MEPSNPSQAGPSHFEFGGAMARRYDAVNHLASAGLDLWWRRRTAQQIARFLRKRPGPLRHLDLACGTAGMAIALSRAMPGLFQVGIDPAAEMLLLARKKTPLPLVQGATCLPFPEGTFDSVSCAFGVRNFTRIDEELREIARVLKPGGRLVILDFFRPGNPFMRIFLAFYRRAVFPLIGRFLTGEAGPYRYLIDSIDRFLAPSEMGDTLRGNGLVPAGNKRFFFGLVTAVCGEKPPDSRRS